MTTIPIFSEHIIIAFYPVLSPAGLKSSCIRDKVKNMCYYITGNDNIIIVQNIMEIIIQIDTVYNIITIFFHDHFYFVIKK